MSNAFGHEPGPRAPRIRYAALQRMVHLILCLCFMIGSSAASTALQASPADWRDQFIYFIVTDRFSDGDPSNNESNGTYEPTNGSGIHGGDLKGIRNQLDYIQALGATGVWITPVVKNYKAYHGYAAQDFLSIDPKLGTLQDLKDLSADLHARSMVLILDIVANHTADLIGTTAGTYTFQYPATYALQYHNSGNQHQPDTFANLNFYHAHGGIQNFSDSGQLIFGELSGLDDLKTESSTVRNALLQVHAWWMQESDADGFRIDTVKHAEYGFWQFFCPALRQAAQTAGKARFFLFGEDFEYDDTKIGSYTGKVSGDTFVFDSMLHFPMQNTVKRVFKESAATSEISATYRNLSLYDTSSRDRLVTFLDNHDMARFLPAGNAAAYHSNLKLAVTFLLTSAGVPVLYYGTEQGFDGGSDPYNREDMWDGSWDFGPSDGDNFNQSHELFCHTQQLASLRRQWSALRRGDQIERRTDSAGSGIYAYSRKDTDAELLIVLNTASSTKSGDSGISTSYPGGTTLYNLFDVADTVLTGNNVAETNQISISVSSLSAKIYASKDTPRIEACLPATLFRLPAECILNRTLHTPAIASFLRAARDCFMQFKLGRTAVQDYYRRSQRRKPVTDTAGRFPAPEGGRHS